MCKIYAIIPVFNAQNYIRKCLDSVLNQTFKNFEIILVDDGSADGSSNICDEYGNKDNRIVVIHTKNGGVSTARNVGLNYLFINNKKGYLTFVDSDDWVDINYFETLIELLEKNKVDIVCSSFNFVNRDTVKPFKHIYKEIILDNLESTRLLVRDESIQSHSVSKLFKIELWENIRYNTDLFYMEDQEVIYKVFYKSKKVFLTNYAGYYYRQDNDNAVTKTAISNKKIVSGLKGYYYPCLYTGFTKEDSAYLLPSLRNALINAYLMLIPYYKRKLASNEDNAFLEGLKKYIRDNKLIKQYIPNGKNNKIKKMLYRMCPPLYPYLFKIAKSIK